MKDDEDQIVINLENVSRGYGKSKVIDNLNLSIKKGSVNCLIGSSGSGKSTILKTILGRLTPDEGIVSVFGKRPHEKGSDFPGSSVGYAPQECALYQELSIDNTLTFFSEIHCMSNELYKQRKDYLIDLLDLPKTSRNCQDLSGGQQRRLSLAAALLHSPKLLILDEPTVGVDPIVTNKIWKYLSKLAKDEGVTILITTIKLKNHMDQFKLN